MVSIPTIASVVLGMVFIVAGASKLAAGDDWPAQARGLGAPAWSIPVVPWAELVIGAGLVTRLAPQLFSVVAGLVLIGFSTLIAMRLREGRHPPCACFGAWSARPLGIGHLLRNGVLLVLALVSGL